MEELNKQIELLKKYNISDYTIENSQIIINGDLFLPNIKQCDKDFLKNTVINGYLYLRSLKSCHKDFLSNTTINGNLYLNSLKECDKDFLSSTIINGSLNLNSLTKYDKDFLKNTIIKYELAVYSLNIIERNILRSNVKQIEEGFNKDFNVIYVEGKISRVYSYYKKDNWVVYKTIKCAPVDENDFRGI